MLRGSARSPAIASRLRLRCGSWHQASSPPARSRATEAFELAGCVKGAMSNFNRIFGPLNSPVPMSYLDDNFSQLEAASTSTVSITGAGLIGFLPSGTGGIARTVQAELRDRGFNVKGFGALGDGSAYDTTAFANAIVAARAANSFVYVPDTTAYYKL